MIQVYSVDEVVHVWSFHAVRRIVHFLLGDLWLAAGGLVQFFPFHAYHAALYLLCHFSYRHHLHLDDLVTTETWEQPTKTCLYPESIWIISHPDPCPIPSNPYTIFISYTGWKSKLGTTEVAPTC